MEGSAVNSSIIIGAAREIMLYHNKSLLIANGGQIELTTVLAISVMHRMWRATIVLRSFKAILKKLDKLALTEREVLSNRIRSFRKWLLTFTRQVSNLYHAGIGLWQKLVIKSVIKLYYTCILILSFSIYFRFQASPTERIRRQAADDGTAWDCEEWIHPAATTVVPGEIETWHPKFSFPEDCDVLHSDHDVK